MKDWWSVETYPAMKKLEYIKNNLTNHELDHFYKVLENCWVFINKSLFESGSYFKSQKIYIHGDFKPDNLVVSNDKINCIDLDNSRYEIREMDFARIARYVWGWPTEKDWLNRAENFMNGYFQTEENKHKIISDLLCGSVLIQPFRECIWQFEKYISTQESHFFNRMQEEIGFLNSAIPLMDEFELEMERITH